MNRLRATGVVDDVTLVARTPSPTREEYRHTLERFGEVPLPSPLPSRERGRGHVANAAPLVARALGMAIPPYRRSLARREPALEAILESDVVFNRGGPFFQVPGPFVNVGLRLAWPLLYARREGIPYALIGEGVGAFGNRWARAFHRRLFQGAAFLAVREELSRRRVRELGVPEERIRTMLDNAFWIEPSRTPRVEAILDRFGLEERRFLAVTVRKWPGAEVAYVPELAKTIDALVPSFVERAVLVPHTFTPGRPEADDRPLTAHLHGLVDRTDRVHLVDEDLTPEELAALFGASAVTFGTRLHSVILAIVGGAPVVAARYLPKTGGVMAGLGLEAFMVEMNDYRSERGVELVRRAASEQRHIPEMIARLRGEQNDELKRFLTEVRARRRKSTATAC